MKNIKVKKSADLLETAAEMFKISGYLGDGVIT